MEKFVHESEEFVARLLDHYDIKWEYEPRMFVLVEDEEGIIRKAFTPDFYLPEFDTFIEVTVMNKPNKKRKKIEMTLKSFPGVNIILLCREELKYLQDKHKFLLGTCISPDFVL